MEWTLPYLMAVAMWRGASCKPFQSTFLSTDQCDSTCLPTLQLNTARRCRQSRWELRQWTPCAANGVLSSLANVKERKVGGIPISHAVGFKALTCESTSAYATQAHILHASRHWASEAVFMQSCATETFQTKCSSCALASLAAARR
jgi:hypothetical protein